MKLFEKLIYFLYFSQLKCEIINEFNVNKYLTNCTNLEFENLENLIGSLHFYQKNSFLKIRDEGLTNGQKIILSNYKNIEIVSSTYFKKIDEYFLFVNEEFIRNTSQLKITIQNSNNNLNNIDLINKKIQFVIVIPFIEEQISILFEQLDLNIIYKPCLKKSQFQLSSDLIFYYNKLSNNSWLIDFNQRIKQYNYLKICFKQIRILSANLTIEENQYPLGSAYMWKKLFDQEGSTSLRSLGYTHFFLMEPDTKPIQFYWLEKIYEIILENRNEEKYLRTDWWMYGSIYRGLKDIQLDYFHINGNAIYYLSTNFYFFLQSVWKSYPFKLGFTRGYDLDIFTYMYEKQNSNITKRIWHKFRFTDFIQNCWHTGCQHLDKDHQTFLIHGNIQLRTNNNQFFFQQKIFIFFLFLFLIGFLFFRSRTFRKRRWKFSCRNFRRFY